tara:strand:+ start:3577 stop:4311 length:735 start_codon:yes stop_codon:yes gene_type:complete
MKQQMNKYTKEDHKVWNLLFTRQIDNLKKIGSVHYLQTLLDMESVLNEHSIPNFDKINKWFTTTTAWKIVVVKGLIPVDEFFELLAQKKFCSSTWIRDMKSLDYLEEPDMFHDTFGHIPLLSNPTFSLFAQKIGQLGVQFKDNDKAVLALQRLYWFTIEFGLIIERGVPKVFGAGIISSYGETNKIVKLNCVIHPFNIDQILEKTFENDVMQEDYFSINNLEALNDSLYIVEQKLRRYELEIKE